MNEETLNIPEAAIPRDNPYSLAGWLSISIAVLFPLGMFLGFIQNAMLGMRYDFPPLGIADVVMVLCTVLAIYVFLRFRSYLHEYYQYKGLDGLIFATIIWSILYELFFLMTKTLIMLGVVYVPHGREAMLGFFFGFIIIMAGFMITIGIIDLNIAIRLLRMKESLGDMMKIFAYVTLIAGICELSLIFVPFSLLLYPISAVVLGLALIKGHEDVEFV